MQRREFLATSLGAILTAGLPRSEPDEWSVYRVPTGDYFAARTHGEAQAWCFELLDQFWPLEAIHEHELASFEGHCFIDDERTPIAPWIRNAMAARPHVPCYLFTAGD